MDFFQHIPLIFAKYIVFCVGGDTYIAPLGMIEFAEDFRKTTASCRVDVGIAPYEFFDGKCNLILAIDGLDEANDAAICAVDGVIRGVFGEQPDLSLFAAEALYGCGVIEKRDHDLSVFGC